MQIRRAVEKDKDAVWEIIKSVIAGGDTYVFDPETPREEMIDYWFASEKYVYVADDNGEILGTFWIKANQPGLGDHVANAAYMVSPKAHGRGIGRKLGEYSIEEAKRLGFTAMQFNFVVSSNTTAVNLWQSLGFEIIGTIPKAFRHLSLGQTDAHVMYRSL